MLLTDESYFDNTVVRIGIGTAVEPWVMECGRIYGLVPDKKHCPRPGIALEIMRLVVEQLKLQYQLVLFNETVRYVCLL